VSAAGDGSSNPAEPDILLEDCGREPEDEMLERVFLHIGVPKTGTKTLQLAMALNRDLLRRHGFVYPDLPGPRHLGFALYAAEPEAVSQMRARLGLADRERLAAFVDEFPSRLATALMVPGVHTAILSNEHCSSHLSSVAEIARLHRLLSPLARRLHPVIYLRRQDELATSFYSAAVQGGHAGEFEFTGGPSWFDYLALLDMWAEIFGRDNLVIRLFEPAQMHPDGLLADFGSAVGFEAIARWQPPPRQNESLDIHALEFLRRFNAHVPMLAEGHPSESRGDIARAMAAISSRDRLTPSAEDAAAFLDKYSASNAGVARKYLNRADGVLFTAAPRREGPERLPSLNLEQAIEIAAKLWQWQQRRLDRHDTAE
jgi:hypothetical protein